MRSWERAFHDRRDTGGFAVKWIDIHAHMLPRCFVDMARAGEVEGVKVEHGQDGKPASVYVGMGKHPCTPPFYDIEQRLRDMDASGIQMQAVSIAPRLFFYERDAAWNSAFCRACNDELIGLGRATARVLPVGGLPMQDAQAAVEEIRRLDTQGVRMVQIGTTVNDLCLDEPRFLPVYRELARRGMLLMLHPLIVPGDYQVARHHMNNVVGNPYQTGAAVGCLIAGGVLDEVSDLKIMLVHGGGMIPYQMGRMDHAYGVRPANEFACKRKPSSYLATNFVFDSLTYEPTSLRYLIEAVGVENVFWGTDYPYHMAQMTLDASGLDEQTVFALQKGNAQRLMGL